MQLIILLYFFAPSNKHQIGWDNIVGRATSYKLDGTGSNLRRDIPLPSIL
jgi:hypothetical protein